MHPHSSSPFTHPLSLAEEEPPSSHEQPEPAIIPPPHVLDATRTDAVVRLPEGLRGERLGEREEGGVTGWKEG